MRVDAQLLLFLINEIYHSWVQSSFSSPFLLKEIELEHSNENMPHWFPIRQDFPDQELKTKSRRMDVTYKLLKSVTHTYTLSIIHWHGMAHTSPIRLAHRYFLCSNTCFIWKIIHISKYENAHFYVLIMRFFVFRNMDNFLDETHICLKNFAGNSKLAWKLYISSRCFEPTQSCKRHLSLKLLCLLVS